MIRAKDLMYGDKLRELRGEELQDWIASKLDISQARLSDYEKGKLQFTDEFIKDLCGFFKISMTEFKKPMLTPSLSGWLLELDNLGLLPRQSKSLGKKLVNLLLRKRISELEKENFELLWKVDQYEAATARLADGFDTSIYVII